MPEVTVIKWRQGEKIYLRNHGGRDQDQSGDPVSGGGSGWAESVLDKKMFRESVFKTVTCDPSFRIL